MTKYFKETEYWIALRNGAYITHGHSSSIMGKNLLFEIYNKETDMNNRLIKLNVEIEEDIL